MVPVAGAYAGVGCPNRFSWSRFHRAIQAACRDGLRRVPCPSAAHLRFDAWFSWGATDQSRHVLQAHDHQNCRVAISMYSTHGYVYSVPALVWRARHKGRAQHLCGGSPDEPWRCPGQSLCQHNPQYTRHPAWCLFAYLGCRSQMAFLCTCTQNFLQALPTGLWTLVARAGEAPVVSPGIPQTTKEG